MPTQETEVPSRVTGIGGQLIDEKVRFFASVWRVSSAAIPDGVSSAARCATVIGELMTTPGVAAPDALSGTSAKAAGSCNSKKEKAAA